MVLYVEAFLSLARVVLVALAASCLMAAPVESRAEGAARFLASDATLRSVCFVDRKTGWAVGDRGTIWHTEDGGGQWVLQHARSDITLYDVHFVDGVCGWAVGGMVQPYTWRSVGVVLKTTNGGRRWTVVPAVSIPELRAVRFFSKTEGVAAGGVSSIFLSGVVRTQDGGRNWESRGGRRRIGWEVADWNSPDEGVVVRGNRVALDRSGRLAPSQQIGRGSTLRAVAATGDRSWIAVGERGALYESADAGKSWVSRRDRLPPAFRDGPDLLAVAAVGRHRWIVGAPGSFVLHSSDDGRHWEVFHTGQSIPLRAVTFVDADHGWAVGALGTILATRDGGRSWHVQRQQSDRAAWWSVITAAEEPPLPWIAQFAAQDGWIGGVTRLGTDSFAIHEDSALDEAEPIARMRRSVMLVGAGFCDAVASSSPAADSTGPSDIGQIEDVWRLRGAWLLAQWRPDVVVLGDWRGSAGARNSRMLFRALVESVQGTAPERVFPQRLRAWGLKPWRPAKVILVSDARRSTARTISMSQFMPSLSRTIENQTWEAALFLRRSPVDFPDAFGWRLVTARNRAAANASDLFDERQWPAGSALRREAPRLPWRLQRLNDVVQALRRLDRTLESPQTLLADEHWFGRFQQMTHPLPAVDAGNYLFRLGMAAAQEGCWEESFDVMEQFLRQYQAHPLTEGALWWLLRHRASREIAIGQRRATERAERSSADHVALMRLWMEQLTARSLTYGNDPRLLLPYCAAQRDPARTDEQIAMLRPIARRDIAGRYAALARGEIWIADGRGAVTVPRYRAMQIVPPLLDGKLDDPAWKAIAPLKLVPNRVGMAAPAGRAATELWFAWDARYLYLACRCPQRPGRRQAVTARERRDAASRDLDHVSIELDIDRDYGIAFELLVDCRGQVSDSAAGSPAWEPKWHVAVRETTGSWQMEAAVPLKELGAAGEDAGPLWGLRVRRGARGWSEEQWPPQRGAPWGWLERITPSRVSLDR